MPAFDALNADHVLHIFEDWNYTDVSRIGVDNRPADGGGPWSNTLPGGGSPQLLTTGLDPYGGVKKVVIDYTAAPGVGAANGFFVDANQNFAGATPQIWQNMATVKDSFVIEFCFQWVGSNYAGKISDFQPTGGTDRINMQNGPDEMGFHASGLAPDPSTDPLILDFYSSSGTVKRWNAQQAPYGVWGFVANRTANDINSGFLHAHPQNINYGSGAGLLDFGNDGSNWGSIGRNLTGNGWYRFVSRYTLNNPNSANNGHGRIEMWLQQGTNTPIKFAEYYGDTGLLCDGQVIGRDVNQGSSWLAIGTHWSFFNLTAVGPIFTGGCTLHVGRTLHWSHSRIASPVVHIP